MEFFWICRDAPSFGWFQSLLQEVEAAQADRKFRNFTTSNFNKPFLLLANFLRINIYLTQKIADDMLWNIAVNDAGADYDPLTLLRSRTMFGRPDWKSIYGRMLQAIESGQYIPGTHSQLKTTVGVCRMLTFMTTQLTLINVRHTSVALVRLQRPSRKRRWNIRRRRSTSLSLR